MFESHHRPPFLLPPHTLLSQIVYLERFENKLDSDTSSVNLVRCSYFDNMNTSQSSSDDQVPYTVSSMSQRNQEQSYEDMNKQWLAQNPSRNSSIPPPDMTESLGRSRYLIPYSEPPLQPSTHTIILDFSMVNYVDSQALVVLRQVSTTSSDHLPAPTPVLHSQ